MARPSLIPARQPFPQVRADRIVEGFQKLEDAGVARALEIVDPTEVDFAGVRFVITSHVSEISSRESHCTLVLSQNSTGHLAAQLGAQKFETNVADGMMTFCPPGMTQLYDFTGHTTNTVFQLPASVFERAVGMDARLSVGSLEPTAELYNPRLRWLMQTAYSELARGEMGWQTLAESTSMRLAVELMRIFGSAPNTPKVSSKLAASQIDLVSQFVDANLEENFTVSDMAGVLGMDQFTFSRSLKKAIDLTPHQFAITRRLTKAQELLSSTKLTLADIAYATGFSSQSHMTTLFNTRLGVTPAAYRRQTRD